MVCDRRTLLLAAAVFPHPILHRLQAVAVRCRDRYSALHADSSADGTGIPDFLSQLDFENYWFILEDCLYINAYLSSLKIAAIATFLTLLVAYPMAYGMASAPKSVEPTLMMLVILPFWTSFLIRIYAWIAS